MSIIINSLKYEVGINPTIFVSKSKRDGTKKNGEFLLLKKLKRKYNVESNGHISDRPPYAVDNSNVLEAFLLLASLPHSP